MALRRLANIYLAIVCAPMGYEVIRTSHVCISWQPLAAQVMSRDSVSQPGKRKIPTVGGIPLRRLEQSRYDWEVRPDVESCSATDPCVQAPKPPRLQGYCSQAYQH